MTRISAGVGSPGVGYSPLANTTVPQRCELGGNLPQNWNQYLHALNNIRCVSLDLRFSEPAIKSNQVFLKLPNTNDEIGLAELIGQINDKRIMQPIAGVNGPPIIIINLNPAAAKNVGVLSGIKQLEATYRVKITIDTLQPAHDVYDNPPPRKRQVPTGAPIAKLI